MTLLVPARTPVEPTPSGGESTATRTPDRRALPSAVLRRPVLRRRFAPLLASGALGLVALLAAGLSAALPGLLSGAPVSNGNMRGTAIVVLVAGLPVLVAAMIGTALDSARALVVWLGTLGYLLYQAVLFCFATPLNELFLAYIAYLGLALWSIVLLLRDTDLDAFAARLSSRVPARAVGGFAILLLVLNAGAWLSRIVPALVGGRPMSLVAGTGLLTNPVYVQDLAIWLPLLAAAAVASWRRTPWGVLVAAAMLTMFVLESISISVDQWSGSRADPISGVSSVSMVTAFAVVAVVTAVPLVWFLHRVDRSR